MTLWYQVPYAPAILSGLMFLCKANPGAYIDKWTTTGNKDLRGNPNPWVSPNQTETCPGSGNIFKNIFESGQLGEFYFGSEYFLQGYETFFPEFLE